MNQWVQNYNPISNVWLSTAVAAVPVVVLFYLLAVKKTHAHRAAIYGFLTSVLIAGLVFECRGTWLRRGGERSRVRRDPHCLDAAGGGVRL
jgi:hypothetical protein